MTNFKCLNPECGSEDTLEIGGVVDFATKVRCNVCGQISWYPIWYSPEKKIEKENQE